MGEWLNTRFSWVRYALFGIISALFIKKTNARLLIPSLLNLFIWTAKVVDSAVVRIEILEYW